jgi:hypothetical protein
MDKPIWVIMHIYLEMSQGNSLYSYLKQNVFFFKNGEQEGKKVLSRDWYQCCGEEDIRKGSRRVNMVEILYSHV